MADNNKFTLNNENSFILCGWMINDLNLSGHELIIYAIIYNFSQEKNSLCFASQEYLGAWTGLSVRSVRRVLDNLEKNKLISKKISSNENGRFNVYKALRHQNEGEDKMTAPTEGEDICAEGQDICAEGADKNDNCTIYNLKEEYKSNNIGKRTPKKPFIKPSLEEVQAYCTEKHYSVNPQRFIDYYDSNGWKVGKNPMKDWKAAVRTWQHNGYSNGGYSTGNSTTCGNNNPADYNDIFE